MEKNDSLQLSINNCTIYECSECSRKAILIQKYQKLVHLLYRKLHKLNSMTKTQEKVFFHSHIQKRSDNEREMETQQTKKSYENARESIFGRKVLMEINREINEPLQSIIVKERNKKPILETKLAKTAPSFFTSEKKVIRQSRYLEVIHKLQLQIQLKNFRIDSLGNQLYSAKNMSMHIRKIIHEFLKSLRYSQNARQSFLQKKQKKWQILAILLQLFQYSEPQVRQIFGLQSNQTSHIKKVLAL